MALHKDITISDVEKYWGHSAPRDFLECVGAWYFLLAWITVPLWGLCGLCNWMYQWRLPLSWGLFFIVHLLLLPIVVWLAYYSFQEWVKKGKKGVQGQREYEVKKQQALKDMAAWILVVEKRIAEIVATEHNYTPYFPGRTEEEFLQTVQPGSPSIFYNTVRAELAELQEYAPFRYRELLAYMPQAVYDPEYKHLTPLAIADSAGYFSIQYRVCNKTIMGNYCSFRYALYHELGHNVMARRFGDWSEDAAKKYASEVWEEVTYAKEKRYQFADFYRRFLN